MPLPESYDDFDPDAHDREAERIRDLLARNWNADLRNLQSEAEAERDEAARAAKVPRHDARAIREAFEAANPEPPRDDFDAHADWQWRRLEDYYVQTENPTFLHRHRMERGAYVARYAAGLRRAKAWCDELFRPLRENPRPPGEWVPIPWPEGDGVTGYRIRFADPERLGLYGECAAEEPSFDATVDVEAASFGWFQSLYADEREPTGAFRTALKEAVREVRRAYRAEYLPGHVGDALLALRRGVLHYQDALAMLDGFRGYEWMTARAFDRLGEVLDRAVDTAADRYAELRALYDAYRQRADRLLKPKGGRPAPDRLDDHPLLPDGYDDFDPVEHGFAYGDLCVLELRHSQDDLRSLASEVETGQIEAACARRPARDGFRVHYEAYAEAHPEPGRDDPDRQAEWEWARLEYAYEASGSAVLHRHRMERGAYIERTAAQLWESKRRLDAVRADAEARRASGAPPLAMPDPVPWPVGDGVSEERRRQAADAERYGDDPPPEGALDEPSYDRALDLSAGVTGWLFSLTAEQIEVMHPAMEALLDVAHGVCQSYEPEYRPGTIGEAQRRIRAGVLGCDEALFQLDALLPYDWHTPAADARLRELVEAVREAALDRYVVLRALYDAYRERALRILGPEGVAGV